MNGHHLVHTVPSTGKMQVLVKSGTWARATRRAMFFYDRILGIASDTDFLYVLMWNSGRIYDRQPSWSPDAPIHNADGTFSLVVFNLSDGSRAKGITIEKLKTFAPPDPVPVECCSNGPLKLTKHKLSFYGIDYEIGRRSISQEFGRYDDVYEASPNRTIDSDKK